MSTKDNYVADMNEQLKLDENKTEGTFGQDIIGAVGYELAVVKDTQIDTLLDRAFATTAKGKDLDLCGADVGLERKQATYSTIMVRIGGYAGQVVGTEVKITYSNLIYTSTEVKNIPDSGSIDVKFKCDTAGADGNIKSGVIFDFVGSYYGLTSAVAVSNGEGEVIRKAMRLIGKEFYLKYVQKQVQEIKHIISCGLKVLMGSERRLFCHCGTETAQLRY